MVNSAERLLRTKIYDVGSDRDAAIERVILDRVGGNQVVMALSSIVTYKNASGVLIYQVVRDGGMIRAA